MNRAAHLRALVALVAALAACGSTTPSGGDGGSVVKRDPQCPATPPPDLSSCDLDVVTDCEYDGGDTAHACRTKASCMGGSWYVTKPSATCGSHAGFCPPTFTTLADGASCPVGLQGTCDYDEGRCGCLPCQTSTAAGQMWACRRWSDGGDGCPAVSPLAGTACSVADQFCYYGGFCGIGVGNNYKCTGGYWRVEPGPAGSCGLRVCGAGTK